MPAATPVLGHSSDVAASVFVHTLFLGVNRLNVHDLLGLADDYVILVQQKGILIDSCFISENIPKSLLMDRELVLKLKVVSKVCLVVFEILDFFLELIY